MTETAFFSVSMSLDGFIVAEALERTGASVMGKRMFDAGEQMWPEEPPFHTPVFVVTHEEREPSERPGGPPSTSPTTALSPPLTRRGRPLAAEAFASRVVDRRSWST